MDVLILSLIVSAALLAVALVAILIPRWCGFLIFVFAGMIPFFALRSDISPNIFLSN